MTGLDANGLQSRDSFRTQPEAVTGEAVLARHFAAGEGNPVQVIGTAEAASQLQSTLSATPGSPRSPARWSKPASSTTWRGR